MRNPIAELEQPDSGRIVTPQEADKMSKEISNKPKFFCPDHDCRDEQRILILVRPKSGNYFFRHKPNCEHDIRPETLLHKLAVKWFEGKENYELPSFKIADRYFPTQTIPVDPSKTQLEYRKLERIIPDVKLTTKKGLEFAIEIVVTSDVSDDKRKLIEQFNLPTIRVDLSEFYYEHQEQCQTNYEFVQSNLDKLLTDPKIKSWVVPPKDISGVKGKLVFTEKSKSDYIGCFLFAGFVGAIWWFFNPFGRR